jgi:hypothetical protein
MGKMRDRGGEHGRAGGKCGAVLLEGASGEEGRWQAAGTRLARPKSRPTAMY